MRLKNESTENADRKKPHLAKRKKLNGKSGDAKRQKLKNAKNKSNGSSSSSSAQQNVKIAEKPSRDYDELVSLEKAEQKYQSNLFRLELEELIAEITVPQNAARTHADTLSELVKSLQSLQSVSDLKFSDLSVFEKRGVAVPLGELSQKLEGCYSFVAPAPGSVFVVGAQRTGVHLKRSTVTADVCVQMPDECFHERDYLNYRYFVKRSLYAAHVYMQLTGGSDGRGVSRKFGADRAHYEFVAGVATTNKPLLSITFKSQCLEVLLHFVPSDASFKLHRFNPNQNNVRRDWFQKQFGVTATSKQANATDAAANKEANNDEPPNPFYNYQMLADVRAKANNDLLASKLSTPSVRQGIQLLKLWLLKRGLSQGYGAFDSFTLAMFVVHLLMTRKINDQMSNYQIFRITLLSLSEANWHQKGLSLKDSMAESAAEENSIEASDTSSSPRLTVADFHKHYQVVFLDQSGYLNICATLSAATFLKVKHDAAQSIRLLNNELADSFDHLFIRDHSLDVRYDALLRINAGGEEAPLYVDIARRHAVEQQQHTLADHFNSSYCVARQMIERVICEALSSRTNVIFFQPAENVRWSIKSKAIEPRPAMLIGLVFNEKYDNALIKGPSSLTPAASEFRRFWGSKSELRRFEDTTICEAVYFGPMDASGKRLVYADMLRHLFKLHFAMEEWQMSFCDRQLNPVLALPTGIVANYGTGEERLADVCVVFDELAKLIKGLRDLPLAITNLQGVSAAFRATNAPHAPLPCCFQYEANSARSMQFRLDHKYVPRYPPGQVMPPYVEPLRVLCQLESSGKWPDNLECMRRLKTAYYVQLVQLLRDAHALTAFTNVDHCDVVYRGYVFRLFVCTMNELLCLKVKRNAVGIAMSRDSAQSLAYEKLMLSLPRVTSAVHALQQKYSCFSGVCRLAKRWLSAHFLIEYFDDEAVDLICAHLYQEESGYEPARSIIFGFVRFLELLATFDWKSRMLVVNFNGEFTKEQLTAVQNHFKGQRSALPPVFIATPYDGGVPSNSTWTSDRPSLQQLCRVVLLAKQSLVKLRKCAITFESSECFKDVFRPNTAQFDVSIQLKPAFCVNAFRSIDIRAGTFLPRYRDYDAAKADRTYPVVDFDPVRLYVEELRAAYDDVALFFYDAHGATSVHVLFRPDAVRPQPLSVERARHRLIDPANSGQLVLNVEAILEDFRVVGAELVESVHARSDSALFK